MPWVLYKNIPFYLYDFNTYEFQHSVFSFLHRSVVQQHGLGHSHVNQNHKRSAQILQWNRSRKILSLIWFHPTGYAHTSLIEFLHVQNFLGPGKNIKVYVIYITNHRAIFEISVNFDYLWKQVKQACSKQYATSETKQARKNSAMSWTSISTFE